MRPRSCVNLAASENSSGLALMGPPVRLIRVDDATDSMRERHSNQLWCGGNLRRHTSLLGRPQCSTYRKYASHCGLHRYLVWLATCHRTQLTHCSVGCFPESRRLAFEEGAKVWEEALNDDP